MQHARALTAGCTDIANSLNAAAAAAAAAGGGGGGGGGGDGSASGDFWWGANDVSQVLWIVAIAASKSIDLPLDAPASTPASAPAPAPASASAPACAGGGDAVTVICRKRKIKEHHEQK